MTGERYVEARGGYPSGLGCTPENKKGSYCVVPDFYYPILRRASSLPSEHGVQTIGQMGVGQVGTEKRSSAGKFVILVVVQSLEGFLRLEDDFPATVLEEGESSVCFRDWRPSPFGTVTHRQW